MGALTSNSAITKPLSPVRLRAQRANAQLSTGPRTPEGRRRAAFNRLRLPLEYWMRRDLERNGQSLAELRRLWHDLLAIFWFVDPGERYYGIYWAAWHWWKKLDALRRENSTLPEAESLDAPIEQWLGRMRSRFAEGELYWQRRIRAELGAEALRGNEALRITVEQRLAYFGAGQDRREAPEMDAKKGVPDFLFGPSRPKSSQVYEGTGVDLTLASGCPETDPRILRRSEVAHFERERSGRGCETTRKNEAEK